MGPCRVCICSGAASKFLSLILTLTAGGRGYALAGLVMGLFGLTIVLVSPFRAWMVDRHGPRRALPPMAAGFAAILIAIAVIPPRSGMNDAVIAVLVAAAGACAPPLGVVMRMLWSALIDDRNLLQAAYSLDGVAEELLYVTGPVVAGVIIVVATPAVGLLVTAGLVVAGTGLFLRSTITSEHPAGHLGPVAGWCGSRRDQECQVARTAGQTTWPVSSQPQCARARKSCQISMRLISRREIATEIF